MDGSSHFFNYGLQDEGDGRYHQVFDDPDLGNQHGYHPAFASAPFTHSLPPSVATSKVIRPAPEMSSALPTPSSSNQLGIGDFTYAPGVGVNGQSGRLESPGLSSASSNTPDTRSSHNFTPDYRVTTSGQSQQMLDDALFARPETAPPARKRRPRKLKTGEDVGADEEEAKRNKFLERNRVAASKCRQKKKEWVSELEETKFELESQNSHLQMEYSGLVDEVSRIRAQLMTHANCNDPNIDKWLENEAKRYVIGTGERFDAMLANINQPQAIDHRHESMSSNSAYPPSNANELLSPATQRGSLSLPTSAGLPVPGSPFFRQGFPNDAIGRPLTSAEPCYMTTATTGEDMSEFDHLHVAEGLI